MYTFIQSYNVADFIKYQISKVDEETGVLILKKNYDRLNRIRPYMTEAELDLMITYQDLTLNIERVSAETLKDYYLSKNKIGDEFIDETGNLTSSYPVIEDHPRNVSDTTLKYFTIKCYSKDIKILEEDLLKVSDLTYLLSTCIEHTLDENLEYKPLINYVNVTFLGLKQAI